MDTRVVFRWRVISFLLVFALKVGVAGAEINLVELTISVHDQTGTPLSYLPLQITKQDRHPDWSVAVEAETDAEGVAEVDVLPGKWRVQPDRNALASRGFLVGNGLTVVAGVEDVKGELVVYFPDRELTVHVEDPHGQPAPFLDVNAYGRKGQMAYAVQARTDREGTARLAVVDSTWQIWVTGFGLESRGLLGPGEEETLVAGMDQEITMRLMEADKQLTIRVQDSSGNPVPYLRVFAFGTGPENDFSVEGQTNSEGIAALSVVAGEWLLGLDTDELGLRGLLLAPESRSVLVESDAEVSLEAIVPNRELAVRVVDNSGDPVRHLRVVAYGTGLENDFSVDGQTNSDGIATLALVAGEWRVGPYWWDLESRGVFFGEDEMVTIAGSDVEVILEAVVPGRLLRVRVEDPSGNPIPFLHVSAAGTGEENPFATEGETNLDGLATLSVVEGEWRIGMDLWDLESRGLLFRDNAPVLVGEAGGEVTLMAIIPERRLTVRVEDPKGNPVPFVGLSGSGTSGESRYSLAGKETDVEGRAVLEVPDGEWMVSVDDHTLSERLLVPVENPQTVSVEGEDGQITFPTLALDRRLEVRVEDDSGQRIPFLRLSAVSRLDSGNTWHQVDGVTGKDGIAYLPVRHGSWNIYADEGFLRLRGLYVPETTIMIEDLDGMVLLQSLPLGSLTITPPSLPLTTEVRLNISGKPGRRYTLSYSRDLTEWSVLNDGRFGDTSETLIDPAPDPERRFYRLMVLE